MNKFRLFSIITGFITSTTVIGITLDIPEIYKNNISAIAIDTNNNQLIYSYESDTPRLIASNMKLFTTLIALEKLKPDYRYKTNLYYTGEIKQNTLYGNLYLQGSGDPSLTSSDLYQLFSVLKRDGIRKIKGDVIIDNTVFNSTTTYSMLTNDAYDSDTVLPNGLIVDGNLTQLNLKLAKNRMSVHNNLFGYKIVNNLHLDNNKSCTGLYNNIKLTFINSKTLKINGTLSPKCDGRNLVYNLLDTNIYSEMVIKRIMSDFGIKLDGLYLLAKIPSDVVLIGTHKSINLAQMIIEMNYYSVNLIAETLLLTIGVNESAMGNTYQLGKQVYINYLQAHGLYNKALQLENGAGLSRYEKFSVNNIAGLLLMAQNSPLQAIFESSLPTPSGDGTLENRLNEFSGRLHVKTGTLNDTRAYSGYYYAKNGRKYVVSILGNINTQDKNNMQEFDLLFSQLLNNLDKLN